MIPRVLRRVLLLLVLGLALDQGLQHTVLADGELAGRRIAPFDPPLFSSAQRDLLARLRGAVAGDEELLRESQHDGELGWAPRPGAPHGALYRYDERGARIAGSSVAAEPGTGDPARRRVVLVGCSFTRGDEVRGEHTWAAALEEARPDLELVNLGMGGYGIDQALLRWRRDGRPLRADEVWLGVVPTALRRILGHYPPAQRHWAISVLFKPRFVLDGQGALVHVPNPAPTREAVLALLDDQRAFLAAVGASDHWVRRAPLAWAPRGSSWLHALALPRLVLTWHEGLQRDPRPWLRDPTSEVRRLALAIATAFRDECGASGATFRVVVLPGPEDLRHARGGERAWSGLLADLDDRGIEHVDLTDVLLAAEVDRDPDAWMPGGHYAPQTNALVGATLAR